MVESIWKRRLAEDKMEDVWKKVKALKPLFRRLSSEEYKVIIQRIENARMDLITVQEKMQQHYTNNLLEQEKHTLQQLEKWSLIGESILKQKSRVKWITLGDANTKYFSAIMKERSHMKQILEITTMEGRKLTNPASIKEEFINFYKNLMGSSAKSLPAINKETMQNSPKLTNDQQLSLVAEVSEEETYEGLCAIHEDKAPGLTATIHASLKRHGL
ncbi:PREDICTED: uncharacterized protein LOC109212056 [Nicotiana attenuata]|uniref:uncharacterized protein LOC109212056 n=1 Tax=Nicotiana attenuata TaxID=49451 RepID=UPI00090580AD|nr:PREDICTED: uncharacterized protein LOC109212056 [Nicotiana attenuata]